MRFFSIFLILALSFSTTTAALRRIEKGDLIPKVEGIDLTFKGKKLILYLKSSDPKSISFFEKLAPELQLKKNLHLFVVDASSSLDSRVKEIFKTIKSGKDLISDPYRKIFNSLGIIIIPSLLFIKEDNTLHSFVAGYKSNLPIFFKSYLGSLIRGKKAGNVFADSKKAKQKREISKLLKQGFRLFINEQFNIALSLYRKSVEMDSKNINGALGVGYSLLSLGKIDEGIDYFEKLKQDIGGKRVLFGYYYSKSLKTHSKNNLVNMAIFAIFEPRYFIIINDAARILEEAGKIELSKNLHKHSFKILLRFYRRNK